MAGQADGSVYVNTELDPEGFRAGSKQMKTAIKSLNTQAKGLGTSLKQAVKGNVAAMSQFKGKASELKTHIAELETQLEALGNKPVATEQYKQLTKAMDAAVAKAEALRHRQKDMRAQGVSESSARWKNLQVQIDQAVKDVDRYHAACFDMESSGAAFKPGSDTSAYSKLVEKLNEAKAALSDMQRQEEQAKKKGYAVAVAFRTVGKTIMAAAKTIGSTLVKGLKGVLSLTRRIVAGNKSYKKSFNGIFSSVKRIGLGLLGVQTVYTVLQKAVATYMEANQGLANQLSSCWTSLGNLLGPLITKIINLVATAISYVTAFLKLLGMTGSAASDAVEGAGGAAEKAQKSLTGFDEINALQDNSSGGGGGGGAGSTPLPEVSLPDWVKLMIDQIKAGDWAGAATTLTTELNAMVASVDWAGVGDSIGYYFNGVLTFLATAIIGFNWQELGSNFAVSLNHIITGVDWGNLGIILSAKLNILLQTLTGFFATLDPVEFGNAIHEFIMGGINAVDWVGATGRLAQAFSDFVLGINLQQFSADLSAAIITALDSISAFFHNTDLQSMFDELMSGIDWGGIADSLFGAVRSVLASLPNEILTVGAAFAAWKISSTFMTDLGIVLKQLGLIEKMPLSVVIGATLAITGLTLEIGGVVDAVENEVDGLNFAEIIGGGLLTTGGSALLGSQIANWISTAFAGSAIDLIITETGINIGVGTAAAAGAAMAAAVAGIIVGIPAMFVGIYDACTKEIGWLNALLTGAGATAAGAGIGAIIGMCGGPIGAGIGALIGLAVGLVVDGIILIIQKWDVITEFLETFFTVTIPGVWNRFVGWLKTVPAALGDFFSSLPGKISKWFSNIWQPIKDFDWNGLGNDIGSWLGNAVKDAIHFITVTVPNWFSELFNSIIRALTTFFTVTLPTFFTETLPAAFAAVVDFIKVLPQKLWEGLQSGWNWLVDMGHSIVSGIWEGLQTVWVAITNFVQGFVQGFKDALGIHSPSTVFAEIGDFLIQGLLEGITNAWSTITEFFGNALSSIGDAISSAWSSVVSWTETAWTNVKTTIGNACDNLKQTTANTCSAIGSGISSAWNNVKSWTSTAWTNVKSTVSNAWSNVKSAASSGYNTVKSGISSAWNSIKSSTSTTWSNIKSSFSTTWSNIKSAASTGYNAVKSGISSAWSSIKSTTSTTWSNIKSTIQNQGWSGIGSNICSGLKNGISNGWTTLTNWVKEKAKSLLNAAKSALGIHSPSRLFRDEVGVNIGLGIGEGVEDSERSVLDSVAGVADAIAAEFAAGEYTTGTIILTAEIDGAITSFTDKITDSFTALMEKMDAIAKRVTFNVPAFAGSVVPYRAAAAGSGGVTTIIEESNDELARTMESTSNRQLALLREQNNLLRQLLEKDTEVTAVIGTDDIVNGLSRKNRRDGKTVVPVGA